MFWKVEFKVEGMEGGGVLSAMKKQLFHILTILLNRRYNRVVPKLRTVEKNTNPRTE